MQRPDVLFAVVAAVSLMAGVDLADAQWKKDGVLVSSAPDNQLESVSAPDGQGGAVIAWYDTRNGTTSIYARRVSSAGVPMWTVDGVAICTAANTQDEPEMVSDGAGGAIITWQDRRTGGVTDVYAQRVNSLGVVQWTSNGIGICTSANSQDAPRILADGSGGAFIVWQDFRGGSNYDVYAQRVTGAGNQLWGTNGAAVCTAAGNQINVALLTDGAGGLFVTWEDYRSGNADIYMQEVNPAGLGVWTSNGIVVSAAIANQTAPRIITDGAGGVIIAWDDARAAPAQYSVYAQRVTSVGVPWWNTDGFQVWAGGAPSLVPDGAGGAIVTYQFDIGGGSQEIFAQRVTASGTRIWSAPGVTVSGASGDQVSPRAIADDEGGAVIMWTDQRSGSNDVYAQHVTGDGTWSWLLDGIAIASGTGSQYIESTMSDGVGGSMVTIEDNGAGTLYDVRVQRIDDAFGFWGHPEPVVTSVADVPADQGGKVKVNWKASNHDRLGLRIITHYSIWRAVDAASVSAAHRVAGPAAIGAGFHGQAVFKETSSTVDYYWEWIGNQDATFDPAYSFAADTRADSVATNLSVHQFRVIAHTDDPFVLFKSLPAFGYSVDNLAPAAPLFLTAQRVGQDVHLKWNRVLAADLRDYSIYRKTSSGVTPVPVNFLGTSTDTIAVDASVPSSALYYIVTALDVHANRSRPSNEAGVSAQTGAGPTPALTALQVRPNYPNPFSTSTRFEVGLPARSDILFEVFDAAGRRVSELEVRGASGGWQSIPWTALDRGGRPMASGVYFYRIQANGTSLTRKMVIMR